MALNPASSDILQSIRSSCDRCRCFKLKCVVPAESTASAESDSPLSCQRCTRAKAPCVFGRRRRANRLSNAKKRSLPHTFGLVSTAAPEMAMTKAAAPDLMPTCEIAMECEPEAAQFDVQSWDSESLPLGLLNNISSQQSSMSDWDWNWDELQRGFSLDDAYIMNADKLPDSTPISWSPSSVPPLPVPSQPTNGAITISDGGSGNTVTNSSESGQQLVALIADMQQCLEILKEGPWQHDSARSLDDYPVGYVLHLSQQFSTITGLVLSRSCASGMISKVTTSWGAEVQPTNCERNNGDSDGEQAGLREPGVDTVTTLLVLSGYVMLVRIYSIVLGHFQMHLSHIPSDSNRIISHHGTKSSSANTNPTLQLGELPSAAPVLGRIHTAVCMLLAALHNVEEQLGEKGAVARNLVMALLTQDALSAGELNDNYSGLSRKIYLVKKFLQEKTFSII